MDRRAQAMMFGMMHLFAVFLVALLVYCAPEWNGEPGLLHAALGSTEIVRMTMVVIGVTALADFTAPSILRARLGRTRDS